MARHCDGCTMCCVLPEQRELQKPAGVVCEHCAIGTGCTIYKHRPQGCRSFDCLWLLNESIPDELRPDRIGVVFEPMSQSRTCLALVDQPQRWREPGPMRIIDNLLEHDAAVVVTYRGQPTEVLAPKGRDRRSVLQDLLTEYAEVD